MAKTVELHCQNCQAVSRVELKARGSCLVTLVLLCLAIVPGIIYEVWREYYAGKEAVCPKCGKRATGW